MITLTKPQRKALKAVFDRQPFWITFDPQLSVMVPARVEIPLADGSFAVTNTFQLLQWKHAIGMEMVGLKNSRGSVTAHVKRILKMKGANREAVHKYITECLDDIEEQIKTDD